MDNIEYYKLDVLLWQKHRLRLPGLPDGGRLDRPTHCGDCSTRRIVWNLGTLTRDAAAGFHNEHWSL
jgi:hypothetical protein